MHGKEGAPGADDGDPEMELAEGFVHEASGHEREPIVDAGKDGEGSGHCHDEMEVSDDEEGVVEVGVERGLGEDGAGEASRDEEREEAEGEEHRSREAWTAGPESPVPQHGEPAEDFDGGGNSDSHGGEGEGGSGVGIHAADE